jgi:aryl-alcohol dehydrogenase-like predicted oxidoreductase
MRRTRLGKTDTEISVIGLGSWGHGGLRRVKGHSVGWAGHDDESARRALREAYAQGIDHWDTADVYGDGRAEGLMGEVLAELPRDRLFLATKVGWDAGPHGQYYHPEQIRARLERSLRLLRTEHVDLYYLHHCDFGPQGERLGPALEVLERFREEGKIRFVGLSDWSAERLLHYAPRVRPDVIQPFRTVRHDELVTSGLREWAIENDVGVVFFSPLRHGLLLGKHSRPPDFPVGDHRARIPEFSEPGFLRAMRECRAAVETRFPERADSVLWALTATLVEDTPGSCVLLGLRTEAHARAAGALGDPIEPQDARWVRSLYRAAAASPSGEAG